MTTLGTLPFGAAFAAPFAAGGSRQARAAARALLGVNAHVPEAEQAAVRRVLDEVRWHLTQTCGAWSGTSGNLSDTEMRAKELREVISDHRWRVATYSSFWMPGRPGWHLFNLLLYRASDGRTYVWTVDYDLGRAVIAPCGAQVPLMCALLDRDGS